MDPPQKHEKIKLVEINSYLTCYLCKGYLIDATTISECLHSFCRSCIIKFLQENCYCPVCEVIINKAKPCLKLDKTLQDIVYKLVPGLFVKEMYRRKEFYQNRPALAPKVSPEERGEDTERTIFNPQDAISLSIEYISDDSAPGAIPVLPLQNNKTQQQQQPNKNGTHQLEEPQDNPMKRYLQCPGMCRIEVLKKFVRNKYNVDTNKFHIDILYKRVPLPDHYTLIDIGYIYSWKRNEPMKFFFRITDINKVAERFDYFNGRTSPEIVQNKPTRIKHTADKSKKKDISSHKEKEDAKQTPPTPIKATTPEDKKKSPSPVPETKKEEAPPLLPPPSVIVKEASESEVTCEKTGGEKAKDVKKDDQCAEAIKSRKSEVILKPEITEQIKSKIQSGQGDIKNNVYTNITLNRDDNVEIITKVQKVSNKEGHPIGLNIINHTVKKTKVQNNKSPKLVPTEKKSEEAPKKTEENVDKAKEREELEKSNFLKSIELTAKNTLIKETPKSSAATASPAPKPTTSSVLTPKPVTSSTPSSAQKRKNSSPVKNDKEKKAKIEKKPVKIIIQPKSIQNPAVRQIVTNVNQNVNNLSKIVEQSTIATKSTDLQSLIDNCKINIPSSLSITLNEGGEGGARTPPSIPPVKNYIEILKLPDREENNKKDEGKNEKSQILSTIKDKNRNIQTFQKIFEESIIKNGKPKPPHNNNKTESEAKPSPLDLTSPSETSTPKRKILEIASQLQKKTKIEQEKKKEEVTMGGKIAIPRLATQRTLKPAPLKYDFPPQSPQNRPQTSASMHSSSLGLNYTVSVGQSQNNGAKEVVSKNEGKRVSPSGSKPAPKPKQQSPNGQKVANLSPNQLLEKYNIQNLAQLTASFNFNPANYGGGQYTALQHAMLLKQIGHQSWLNQGPLLQYEKYLQSLSATQNKLMGNIKEN